MPHPWLDTSLALEERVQALLAHLPHEDLVAIALGDFTCLAARRLPVPEYVDSGTGLRGVAGATAFPAGIALAATFDPDLAREYGAAVGLEAHAAGFTVVLGPTLDLARDPRAGRIPEALGEDPYLAGLLGAAHVRGLQSRHVIAQLKHYVAYNGEDRRTGYGLGSDRGEAVDVRVPLDMLQDAYLRPFRAAVEAGAWSMMGSYNRVNGQYVCQHPDLLGLPRREWGWQGFYCPDFLFAVRDPAAALAAGLDLGALGGPGGRTAGLVAGVAAEVLSGLAGNLVRALIGSGLVDDPPGQGSGEGSTPAHRDLAERTAIASAVLLRNERGALPFGPDVATIALIGPSGADALFVVGGSAAVEPGKDRLVTPLQGILARAGSVVVRAVQGSLGDVPLPLVPEAAFTLPDGSGPGVEVTVTDATGLPVTEVRPVVNFTADPAEPGARWPGRWRSRLTSEVSGPHRLSLELGGRATVRVDGEPVLVGSREAEQFIHGPHYPLQAVVELVAGVPVLVEIDLEPGPAIAIPPMGVAPSLRLGWQPPDGRLEEAVAAAAGADAAVVLATMASGEGMDRDSLALPGDQDELIRRVAAVNPRTVVVLNTPGAVLLPWLERVAAVLQVWYPGERFGAALAALLFGDAEPGGRLPLTFPHAREHLPGGDHGPEVVADSLDYAADGGIGYRAPGVRRHGAAFGFGHGLGYTATSAAVTGSRVVEGRLRVSLAVSNHGERDTVHVAQLYAQLDGSAPELAGLARVPVVAGGTASAEVEVAAGAFARWNSAAAARLPVPGKHRLWVGTSSTDLGHGLLVSVSEAEVLGAAPVPALPG